MKKIITIMLAGAIWLSACSTSTEMEAHEPWARSGFKGNNGAIYMVLHNHTEEVVELIGAETDAAEVVEIHESSVNANGVMQMNRQESLVFKAGQEIEFKPGSFHFMLIGLTRDLNVSDEITLTLRFANYPDITMTVPVQDAASMGGSGMDGHQMP